MRSPGTPPCHADPRASLISSRARSSCAFSSLARQRTPPQAAFSLSAAHSGNAEDPLFPLLASPLHSYHRCSSPRRHTTSLPSISAVQPCYAARSLLSARHPLHEERTYRASRPGWSRTSTCVAMMGCSNDIQPVCASLRFLMGPNVVVRTTCAGRCVPLFHLRLEPRRCVVSFSVLYKSFDVIFCVPALPCAQYAPSI